MNNPLTRAPLHSISRPGDGVHNNSIQRVLGIANLHLILVNPTAVASTTTLVANDFLSAWT